MRTRELQKDGKLPHFNLSESLLFSSMLLLFPENAQAADVHLFPWRKKKKNQINRFKSWGKFLVSAFLSPLCLWMHVLACVLAWWLPARLRLLLVMGDIDFFFLPPLFSLGFWHNNSTMETKKLLCDRGKPFISAGVNGGLPLITAWVIHPPFTPYPSTHTLTEVHTHM